MSRATEAEYETAISSVVEYRKRRERLKDKDAAPLIGVKLSPSLTQLGLSYLDPSAIFDVNKYYRSDKHFFVRKYLAKARLFSAEHLTYGKQARVGNYRNPLEVLEGAKFNVTSEIIKTTPADSFLYNHLLNYKNHICHYIQTRVNGHFQAKYAENTTYSPLIKVGHYNAYPCVMVFISDRTIIKSPATKSPSDSAFEAWVELLISYFVGMMNYIAYHASVDLPIELERRSSFGHLRPSISSTGKSMRIDVGIIPKAYADLLSYGLAALDKILQILINHQDHLSPVPEGLFYYSAEYRKYLNGKYTVLALKNLFQLLWTQVEKNGKTTLQNIVRTPYALNGISIQVFKHLTTSSERIENFFEAFQVAIKWAVEKLKIIPAGKDNLALSFIQEEVSEYPTKFKKSSKELMEDDFWFIINSLINKALALKAPFLQVVLADLNNVYISKKVDYLYALLELFNEFVFMEAIDVASTDHSDGYGSDSDTEGEVEGVAIYSKKLVVHNGTRAILNAIKVCSEYKKRIAVEAMRICLYNAYYEITPALGILNATIVDTAREANVLFCDLNPCLTNGAAPTATADDFLGVMDNKLIILDSTSATDEHASRYLEKFIKSRSPVIMLVESGFKHMQFDADKNPFGIIRIYAKSRDYLDWFYNEAKKVEPAIKSSYSHHHRRMMKSLGFSTSNKQRLFGKLKKESKIEPGAVTHSAPSSSL